MAESKGSAAIEAERPKIIAAFLPAGEPEKRTEEVDFFAALEPCIREGMEDKVKPLLDQLTSARAGLVWALDKDRTLVEHDEIVGKLKAYLALLKGFRGPAGSAGSAAAPAAPAAAPAAPPRRRRPRRRPRSRPSRRARPRRRATARRRPPPRRRPRPRTPAARVRSSGAPCRSRGAT